MTHLKAYMQRVVSSVFQQYLKLQHFQVFSVVIV